MSKVTHNCGIALAHNLHDAYSLIGALQHRGREAAGLIAIGNGRVDAIKWVGTVDAVKLRYLHSLFPEDTFHMFAAHVRYASRGRKEPEELLKDAHPHVVGGRVEHRGNHVLIRDCNVAVVHNGQFGTGRLGIENRVLQTGCDTEAAAHYYLRHGEHKLIREIPAAYTMIIADKQRPEVIVVRDRTGIKPGVIGWKDGTYLVASEDIAFRKNGGILRHPLECGAACYFRKGGGYRTERVVNPTPKLCAFEFEYIAHADSVHENVSVKVFRRHQGNVLKDEVDPEIMGQIDLITFVPSCPEPAADELSRLTGIPLIEAFYKLDDSARSFQESTQRQRQNSIDKNLFLNDLVADRLRGATVGVVEDSQVRGTVARRVQHLLYEVAGVKEAYGLTYTPKIGIVPDDGIARGCMFGVDMPPDDDFLARGRTDQEIQEKTGMPIHFNSVAAMLRSFERFNVPRDELCHYCMGGPHIFDGL